MKRKGLVYATGCRYNYGGTVKSVNTMRKRRLLFVSVLLAIFVCLWVFLGTGGEAVLLLAPPENEIFKVNWCLTLTDTAGLGRFGWSREHTHKAEAELLMERADEGYLLQYRILKVSDVKGAFVEAPKEGETVDVIIDEKGGMVMSGNGVWHPPFLFWLFPFLSGRWTKTGEEWRIKRKVNLPYLGGVVVEFEMRLASAPFSVAHIEGRVTKPKLVHLLHLAMQLTDSVVEIEFDKQKRLIRYIRLYGLLESVSGSRVMEFDSFMVCE